MDLPICRVRGSSVVEERILELSVPLFIWTNLELERPDPLRT